MDGRIVYLTTSLYLYSIPTLPITSIGTPSIPIYLSIQVLLLRIEQYTLVLIGSCSIGMQGSIVGIDANFLYIPTMDTILQAPNPLYYPLVPTILLPPRVQYYRGMGYQQVVGVYRDRESALGVQGNAVLLPVTYSHYYPLVLYYPYSPRIPIPVPWSIPQYPLLGIHYYQYSIYTIYHLPGDTQVTMDSRWVQVLQQGRCVPVVLVVQGVYQIVGISTWRCW